LHEILSYQELGIFSREQGNEILFSPQFFREENEMLDNPLLCVRYGEGFWRGHHEAWQRSELQQEYCEAQGISLKAFGNGATAAGA
jgi:hypothetical protein